MSEPKKAPPKKESILELQKLMETTVRVKCVGGRELRGILRGYDELVNLVVDDCDEFLRGEILEIIENYVFHGLALLTKFFANFPDPKDMTRVTEKSRKLGLVVVRGTQVSLVSPEEGMEEIANPFVQST